MNVTEIHAGTTIKFYKGLRDFLSIFNYKDGTKTITFDEIAAKDAPEGNGSDLGCFAPPKKL